MIQSVISKKDSYKSEDLIMVKYPYNKLFNITSEPENDTLKAEVVNEFFTAGEIGPIGVAETGRHLAICGSIQLAKEYNFNKPAYFLATHAKLKRTEGFIENSKVLNLEVKTISKEKRTAKISGGIFNSKNELIFDVEIEYQIIQQEVFNKLFSKNINKENSNDNFNPYTTRKKLKNITSSENTMNGSYGVVLAKECKGHFENYPALPVAVVGNLFIDLGIQLFNKHTNNSFNNAIILDTEITALRLAFSGEEVDFSTSIKSIVSDDVLIISGEAKVGNEIISKIEFKIKGSYPKFLLN